MNGVADVIIEKPTGVDDAQVGRCPSDDGNLWFEGQGTGGGQANVTAKPPLVVCHEFSLDGHGVHPRNLGAPA